MQVFVLKPINIICKAIAYTLFVIAGVIGLVAYFFGWLAALVQEEL
jgi:hypothetical protein